MKGLLTSLITVLTFTGLQAQSLPAAPKLVVGLTIDQLRTDYLEAFSSLYGEKGFKRLWKEGRVFHNAEYTFCGIDRASAIAAIYSGTTPSMNGIISQRWMDASTLRPVNSTDDTAFMGYYTDQTVAPTKLLTSTIADELKIATQGKDSYMPLHLIAMPHFLQPDMPEMQLSGSIPTPENGVEPPIMESFRGGQANITTVKRLISVLPV